MAKYSPFSYFKTSPEVILLAVMPYIRFPLSLRNVEDLLHESGIHVSYETVRSWWNLFGPIFAAEVRKGGFKVCGPVAGAGILCDEAAGPKGRSEIPQEIDEALRPG